MPESGTGMNCPEARLAQIGGWLPSFFKSGVIALSISLLASFWETLSAITAIAFVISVILSRRNAGGQGHGERRPAEALLGAAPSRSPR